MINVRFPRSNLHTHTNFCDGKNTPEEMVLAAIRSKMSLLGFSAHSPLPYAQDYAIREEDLPLYRQEILRLKEKYRGQIDVLLGIEQDFDSKTSTEGYDYVIGSVHSLVIDGEYHEIDESRETLCKTVREHFYGDIYLYLRAYYEKVSQVAEKTGCDVVAHFDLVTKFNGDGTLFDENDPRHLRYAIDALDVLLKKDVVFEINTGAISRGYRRIPYPAPHLLRRIAEKGGRVMINSDAHSAENLLCKFDEAIMIARAVGFGSIMEMTANGWRRFNFDRIFAK